MTKVESDKLIAELHALAKEGPDASHRPWTPSRVRAIVDEFQRAVNDTYVNEKRREVLESFDIWHSPRRWQKWGKDGTRFRALLAQSISKLQGAMDSLESRTGTKAYSN